MPAGFMNLTVLAAMNTRMKENESIDHGEPEFLITVGEKYARSLFQDISGRDYKEQIGIIKSKVEDLYNLEEALIIAIFDNMSPNYTKIKDLFI